MQKLSYLEDTLLELVVSRLELLDFGLDERVARVQVSYRVDELCQARALRLIHESLLLEALVDI